MKLVFGDRIEVQWIDAGGDSAPWTRMADFDFVGHLKTSFVSSAGYFINVTPDGGEDHLFISLAKSPAGNIGSVFSIPLRSITSITRLKDGGRVRAK